MKTTTQNNPSTTALEYLNLINLFPFKTKLSFEYLINYWKLQAEDMSSPDHYLAKVILEMLDHAPELFKPVEDQDLLNKHEDLVRLLVSALIPNATSNLTLTGVFPPFQMQWIAGTEQFKIVFQENIENIATSFLAHNDPASIKRMKSLNACFMVLNTFYGTEFNINLPYIFSIVDEETGLKKYFKSLLNPMFSEIVKKGDLPDITKNDIKGLLKNPDQVELWIEKLDFVNHFEVHGLISMVLIDVTEHEIISILKRRLLNKESLMDPSYFDLWQNDLASLLGVPGLHFGLAGFSADNEDDFRYSRKLWTSFLLGKTKKEFCLDYFKAVVGKLQETRKPHTIFDLSEKQDPAPQEQALLNRNILNLMIIPLFDGDKLVGTLEFGSKVPIKLYEFTSVLMKEIAPLFTAAMVRSKEEYSNRLEAIIKEKCTALHDSVEWRFTDAAFELLLKRDAGDLKAEMEPIIFNDVYPLYGQSDIRGSSVKRNEAAIADLIENLLIAQKTINKIQKTLTFPLMDQVKFHIDQHISQLKGGLGSGDEEKILDFLIKEINPLFSNIEENFPEHKKTLALYQKELDPELGLIYRHRYEYEKSVGMINDVISEHLDLQNKKAQGILPHYFEKYKTDGVEYNIYAGNSMLAWRKFDQISLSNLRLWQLVTMCEISQKTKALKDKLPVPMDTSELILIHSAPLAIRFRYDEKRFDVDGTYNIRYEILKKRIDKATIKGTSERLTQTGKIAIVYSHDRDLPEYRKFLEYLIHRKYISGKIEDLELDKLQGVQGLRALRIAVNPEPVFNEGEIDLSDLSSSSEKKIDQVVR